MNMIVKKIKDADNYFISTDGIIKNVKTGRTIKNHLTKQGYMNVSYSDNNGKRKTKLVHALVADTFLTKPDREEKLIIDHIDGDKTNNSVDNLRFVTYSQNSKNAYDPDESTYEYVNDLTDPEWVWLRTAFKTKIPMVEICQAFNMSLRDCKCVKKVFENLDKVGLERESLEIVINAVKEINNDKA